MTAPCKFAQFAPSPAADMRSALTDALVALAMRETDPQERAAKLAILKKDGWL